MYEIRRGEARDLEEVEAIQRAAPEAAQWRATEYHQYDFRVAVRNGKVAGFVVARETAPGEREILNIAVVPEERRRGLARGLIEGILRGWKGELFVEVRESNAGARRMYEVLGFQEVGNRKEYYTHPLETAIVMKFHSC